MTRSYHHAQPLVLESGAVLPEFTLAYTDEGPPDAPVVWICHALTGSAAPRDWWPGLVGAGRLFDPAHLRIVCANVLGGCYGSTGPSSARPGRTDAWGLDFPVLTVRDAVAAYEALRQHLGIGRIHTLVGGSLGGQHALEWAVAQPAAVQHLVLLATNARHSAWGIAFNETQRAALRLDPSWGSDDPAAGRAGMAVARQVAMLSYRSYDQYVATQTDQLHALLPAAERRASTYQQHQGHKLVQRFDPRTYYRLTEMMDSHDVARGRPSLAAALNGVRAATLVVGISSDLLFPPAEQRLLADGIPGALYQEIESPYGHDGFLVAHAVLTRRIHGFYALHDALPQPLAVPRDVLS